MRAQKPRAGERKAVLVPCGACTRAGRTGTSTYNSRTLAITLQLIADVQRNIGRTLRMASSSLENVAIGLLNIELFPKQQVLQRGEVSLRARLVHTSCPLVGRRIALNICFQKSTQI